MTLARSSPELPDDAALGARIQAGDESALATVFTMHHASLCGFAAHYTGDAEQAEELVQEVFLALWEKRASLDLRGGVRAYLFAAVRNRAFNAARHARYERTLALRRPAGEVPGMGRPPRETDESSRIAEIDAAVTEAMRGMPVRMREVLALSWREGLSYAEIARVLTVSPKTVENHISRAFKYLRKALGSRFP